MKMLSSTLHGRPRRRKNILGRYLNDLLIIQQYSGYSEAITQDGRQSGERLFASALFIIAAAAE
jgi:hypothetical protein